MIDGKPADQLNEYVVTQNYYWAMGDNRDDSLDSRYWDLCLKTEYLVKPYLLIFL